MIPSLTKCNSYIIIYQFQLSKFKEGINKLSICNTVIREWTWNAKLSIASFGSFISSETLCQTHSHLGYC